jgi:HD-GYP domain-containing protein (c-di-GMP phosphodiesterase class II)
MEHIHRPLDARATDPRFREELDAMLWVNHQVRIGRPLPVTECEAVTHSLYVNMRADGADRLMQIPLRDMSEYVAVHAVNVALLAMALGEHFELDGGEVRALGLAGLLHDIGMNRVPVELIAKAEPLDPDERALVMQHTNDGARIIIEADPSLALPAVVAYEHHLRADGSGYPQLTYAREAHRVSRIVQVCDAYHALHSPRPFRQSWPDDIISSFISQRAGFEFDADASRGLLAVVSTRMPAA